MGREAVIVVPPPVGSEIATRLSGDVPDWITTGQTEVLAAPGVTVTTGVAPTLVGGPVTVSIPPKISDDPAVRAQMFTWFELGHTASQVCWPATFASRICVADEPPHATHLLDA